MALVARHGVPMIGVDSILTSEGLVIYLRVSH